MLRHPRVQFHFTPTYGSWLNLVERFFGLLTDRALRRGSHTSIPQLREAILAYVAAHNEEKRPFRWTKTADEILDKLRRFRAANTAGPRQMSHFCQESPIQGTAFRRVIAESIEQHLTQHYYTGEGYDLHLKVDAYPPTRAGSPCSGATSASACEPRRRVESEDKYRALFNQMDEAYAVVEVMAGASGPWTNFRFLAVNPAFMRHTGMP